MAKLTAKQQLFVFHYLDTLNATEAAARAGYKGSRTALAVQGYENLRKPNVVTVIAEGMKEMAMPQDEILLRLSAMARGDLFTRKSRGPKGEFESFDTKGAAEILAKHYGLLIERIEQSGDVTIRVEYVNPDADAPEAS